MSQGTSSSSCRGNVLPEVMQRFRAWVRDLPLLVDAYRL